MVVDVSRAAGVLLLAATLASIACTGSPPTTHLSVSLRSDETYTYPTVGGDEEGAFISMQAQHYAVSEIRRDSTTRWVAVYVYQPAAGFVGRDTVQLTVQRNSDGIGPPSTSLVEIRFDVRS